MSGTAADRRVPMTDRLDGRVAIVTGASMGIGEATARTLSAEGASVVLAARGADALDAVAEDIRDGVVRRWPSPRT